MTTFTDIGAEQIESAAKKMKAIAHPVRLEILGYLFDGEELNVTAIHDMVGIEQSTASHHLGILKDKGIVISRRKGKEHFLQDKKQESQKTY